MTKTNDGIPAGATAGELARICGVSERVMQGRKGDGRLPLLPDKRIDVHALLRAGVTAAAARQRAGGGGADAGMTSADRFDAGMQAAARVSAHAVLAALMAPASGEDAGEAAARGLRAALEMLGVGDGGEPIPDRLAVTAGA